MHRVYNTCRLRRVRFGVLLHPHISVFARNEVGMKGAHNKPEQHKIPRPYEPWDRCVRYEGLRPNPTVGALVFQRPVEERANLPDEALVLELKGKCDLAVAAVMLSKVGGGEGHERGHTTNTEQPRAFRCIRWSLLRPRSSRSRWERSERSDSIR